MFVYKQYPEISHYYSREFSSYVPVKFVDFIKSRLIFNIFYCFGMFVNKFFTYLTCAYLKSKRRFNVKSSAYYFQMKTNILADFQIRISVPLIKIEMRMPLLM